MQHLRNSPTSWTKLFTCGNIFKDTIDPQECPSEKFFLTDYSERNRTINEWKGCKLIMCYQEKTIFRLSSHFKRMNRVSNLTAQIKLLHNLNLEWLVSKILWGFFHISLGVTKLWISRKRNLRNLRNLQSPYIFFLKEEECAECEVCFRA